MSIANPSRINYTIDASRRQPRGFTESKYLDVATRALCLGTLRHDMHAFCLKLLRHGESEELPQKLAVLVETSTK